MSKLEKLSVSLTKNGYFKIYEIIEHFPAKDILSHIDGQHNGILLDKSQIINMLSIDPKTESVPPVWDQVRSFSTKGIQALTFISIIFSHYKLIKLFEEKTNSRMRGTIHRSDLDSKVYTNLIDTMNTIGLCKKKVGAAKTEYTMEPLFVENIGQLVKEVLTLKLIRIGWSNTPKEKEFYHDFYEQCLYYKFNKVFGLSEDAFVTWLKSGNLPKESKMNNAISLTEIQYSFAYKNLLFKGVPGTGKSRFIDQIIKTELNLDKNKHGKNILHINIHSASSNADLMQGIGITTTENDQVAYKEKQGLVYDLIRRACYAPRQPFVLVLEEIQENSLNELIGDLIYLIEPTKRLKISKLYNIFTNGEEIPYTGKNGLIPRYIQASHDKYNECEKTRSGNCKEYEVHSVDIPYLVSTSTEYRTMILPDNLYIFCTSNYRDDKKVIEDNLLRRFEVIELYPQYTDGYADSGISYFLEKLNSSILEVFSDEIHPDRFQIGHANWLHVENSNNEAFYKALLKVVVDFKEIKEVESEQLFKVLSKTYDILHKTPEENTRWITLLLKSSIDKFGEDKPSYAKLVNFLQKESYSELLNLTGAD